MHLFSHDLETKRGYHRKEEILMVDLLNNKFTSALSIKYVSKVLKHIFDRQRKMVIRIFYNKIKNRIGFEVRDYDSALAEIIKLSMKLARTKPGKNIDSRSSRRSSPKFRKPWSRQPRGRNLGPQVLRASYMAVLLKNGAPIEAVKQLVGHQSSRTTARYSSTACDPDLKQIHSASHPNS